MALLSAPEELLGKTLGKYRLEKYLGYGAMARVYMAQHLTLQRPAAIKILHAHYSSDSELMNQFIEEAKNLAKLRHPNIVQVYDIERQDSLAYIIMEYVDGPTLRKLIHDARDNNQRLQVSRSFRIVYSLAVALSYAHQRGIVHRDVKPGNVMLENTGRVVLADFGLARILSGKNLTLPGTIKGTPAYMSPEQALGQPSQPRSDIYALGVMFYELLTGQLPFDDENPFTIAMKHVNDSLVPPKDLVPEIPEMAEKIIIKSMSKDPTERYKSVNDFISDLTQVRLQIKTAKLPAARISDLAEKSDKYTTWSVPARESEAGPQICLHFIDTGQIINLDNEKEYTIGRKHKSQPLMPDIDLSPYSSYEWGISRLHAVLSVRDEQVTITDTGSSNGTWHAGTRLEHDKPYPLEHGDTIFIGKLKIQMLIYS